ncbi:hypothetical protein [Streptomyces sp. NPDC048200]|uniref:hypothetical protein n=1 Tax=Streptomyces sp. NPDC048200 TaxID=3365512 RepID=UPI00371C2773
MFVLNPGIRIGPQVLKNRMNTVMERTQPIWSGGCQADRGYGKGRDGYYDFKEAIPVLFTTVDRLQASGPHAELDSTRAQLADALTRLVQAEGRLARFDDERAVVDAALEAVDAARHEQEVKTENSLQTVAERGGSRKQVHIRRTSSRTFGMCQQGLLRQSRA